jgi:hypothetical protein
MPNTSRALWVVCVCVLSDVGEVADSNKFFNLWQGNFVRDKDLQVF